MVVLGPALYVSVSSTRNVLSRTTHDMVLVFRALALAPTGKRVLSVFSTASAYLQYFRLPWAPPGSRQDGAEGQCAEAGGERKVLAMVTHTLWLGRWYIRTYLFLVMLGERCELTW